MPFPPPQPPPFGQSPAPAASVPILTQTHLLSSFHPSYPCFLQFGWKAPKAPTFSDFHLCSPHSPAKQGDPSEPDSILTQRALRGSSCLFSGFRETMPPCYRSQLQGWWSSLLAWASHSSLGMLGDMRARGSHLRGSDMAPGSLPSWDWAILRLGSQQERLPAPPPGPRPNPLAHQMWAHSQWVSTPALSFKISSGLLSSGQG